MTSNSLGTAEGRSAGGKAAADRRAREYSDAADILATFEAMWGVCYDHPKFKWRTPLDSINARLPADRAMTKAAIKKWLARHPGVVEQARFAIAESAKLANEVSDDDPSLKAFVDDELKKCGVGDAARGVLLAEIRGALQGAFIRYADRLTQGPLIGAFERNKAFQLALRVLLPAIADEDLPKIIETELPKWADGFWDSAKGRPV